MPDDHLRAVNVYAICGPASLTLIDAGVAVDASRLRLEAALAALGCGLADVARFLVTHLHYDHYSQAVSVRAEFGTPVWLGRGEQPSLAVMSDIRVRPLGQQFARLRRYGAPGVVELLLSAGDRGRPSTAEDPDEWLDGDTDIELGEHVLRAVHTPGHTQGHMVFVDSGRRQMFAGDHVLPHITPSIGFEPAAAELPLVDYLQSLRTVREMEDMRLLPAHGPVTSSTHERIDELLRHHSTRLDAMKEALRLSDGTAADVARRISWTRRQRKFSSLDPFNQMLAVLETGAHLDLLASNGQLQQTLDGGILHYAAA